MSICSIVQGGDGHYVLVSNKPVSELNYDISQSHMMSCGYGGHTDAPFAASDAAALSSTLVESGLLQQSSLRLCCIKAECSTEAMRSAFKSKASLVGENGLFIFSYHGPAVSVADSTPSLVSSNFRPDSEMTHITATTILNWLDELGAKKPKRILFFLDCQLASKMANSLTGLLPVSGAEMMCIFCANTPSTLSLLSSTLGHSVFTYFTTWAVQQCTPTPDLRSQRTINISTISDKVMKCCKALHSICEPESESTASAPAVVGMTVQPLKLFQRLNKEKNGHVMVDGVGGSEDMIDGAVVDVGRFDFLEKHHKTGWLRTKVELSDQGHCWLHHLTHTDTSPLHFLNENQFLQRQEMLITLHRLVLYRLAVMQESWKRSSTADPNTLIILYVLAAGVVEHVAGGDQLETTADNFHLPCQAYCLALEQHKVNTAKINELARKISQENS